MASTFENVLRLYRFVLVHCVVHVLRGPLASIDHRGSFPLCGVAHRATTHYGVVLIHSRSCIS